MNDHPDFVIRMKMSENPVREPRQESCNYETGEMPSCDDCGIVHMDFLALQIHIIVHWCPKRMVDQVKSLLKPWFADINSRIFFIL